MNVRHLSLGGFLVVLSIIFQLIPVIFGELFVLVTMLSALPIFIMARINPRIGCISFVVAGIMIFSVNSHEGMFFLFTNGPVGVALGTLNHYSDMKGLISLGAGLILTFTLSIMNFVIGFPVFWGTIPGSISIQLSFIFIFSIFYCWFYLYMATFAFQLLNKRYPLL